jgi:transposase-like protein
MALGKARDPRKEQQWRHRIQQWQHSGLSVRAFCARHGLAQPSFYAWRRELRRRDAAAASLVPVRVVPDEEPPPTRSLELVLAGGRRVRVPSGFDPVTLRHLLAVLEEAPPC